MEKLYKLKRDINLHVESSGVLDAAINIRNKRITTLRRKLRNNDYTDNREQERIIEELITMYTNDVDNLKYLSWCDKNKDKVLLIVDSLGGNYNWFNVVVKIIKSWIKKSK